MQSDVKPLAAQPPLSPQGRLPQVTPEMRRAMIDAGRLPRPLSRAYIWGVTAGGTLFCLSLALFAQWLFYHHWHFHSFEGFRWGTALVMVPALAVALRLMMYQAQRRRQAIINRFLVVAEANHHIRNALAVLVAANYLQGEQRQQSDRDLATTYAVIQEAIDRIERTLAEVLPQLTDKD